MPGQAWRRSTCIAAGVSYLDLADATDFVEAIGQFDAAHLLAPVAVASSLGLGHFRTPLIAPFTLGINGNADQFIIFLGMFFPILLNTVAGVRQTDARLLAAARTMGIGRLPLLVHVLVPSALPTIMVGIRLAFASSWAAIVAVPTAITGYYGQNVPYPGAGLHWGSW